MDRDLSCLNKGLSSSERAEMILFDSAIFNQLYLFLIINCAASGKNLGTYHICPTNLSSFSMRRHMPYSLAAGRLTLQIPKQRTTWRIKKESRWWASCHSQWHREPVPDRCLSLFLCAKNNIERCADKSGYSWQIWRKMRESEMKMPASWPSWAGSRGSVRFSLFSKVRLPELRHPHQQGGPRAIALERTVSINLTYTSLYINLTSLYIFMYFVIIQSNWEREFKFLIDSERKSLSSPNCPELAIYLLLIVINLDKKIRAERNELKLQRRT